jgi:hypothetical protein
MGSDNIGRNIFAIVVMFILMALTAKYAFDENANWQGMSAQGLNVRIQTGITQIYWQWQQQGRAKQIEYRPENVKQAFVINMTNKGLPDVEKNEDGCNEFLSWFVDENVLSNQMEVTTNYSERKVSHTALTDGAKELAEPVYSCQFLYANTILEYDLKSGQFTFTN